MRPSRCFLLLSALLACLGCGRSGADNPFDTIAVTVSPRTATVTADASQPFAATLVPAPYQGIDWTVREGATGGSVLPSGLYTAPDAPGTYHLVATSHDNPRKSDTATIRVVAAPAIDAFTASATGVVPGTSVRLLPVFSGGKGVISPGVGAVQSGLAYSVSPTQSTTYTLTVTNDAGTAATSTVAVTVARPPTIQGFVGFPATISLGDSATLVPTFQGGTGTISPDVGAVDSGQSVSVSPTRTTTYTLTVVNDSGQATASATIQVVPPPVIASFTADASAVPAGTSTVLRPVFLNGTGVISPGVGAVTSGGAYAVVPGTTTTYTLSVTNAAGTVVTATATVEVVGIQSFTASPAIITLGGQSVLAPVFGGGTGTITPGVGTVSSGDSIPVSPSRDTTYTLTVSHASGLTATATATVRVVAAPSIQSFTASPNPLTLGQSATLTPVFTGGTGAIAPNVGPVTSGQGYALSPIQTTTYTLTVTNAAGDTATQDLEVDLVPRGVFTATSPMGTPRRDHTATLLADGRVLIAGGISGDSTGQILAVAEVYNPVTGLFSPVGAMAAARQFHTAVRLADGRVLLAGGTGNGTDALAGAEIFDPASGLFTSLGAAALNAGRFSHGAAGLPDGRVLLTGGSNGTVSLTSAELFDPVAGTFTLTGAMGNARQDHAILALADGTVLVAGGAQVTASGTLIVANAERFDPAAGTFAATASTFTTGRQHPAAALLATGNPLFCGGLGFNGQWLNSCDVYTPATRSFTATGFLGGPFQSPAASLLPDGRVLVIGVGGAQAYDPATGQFANVNGTGNLTAGGLTATLLPTGKVLIIGLDGALLFDPQVPQP